MGQRSQIYVKVDDELIIANYYQWNFAERMVSRARYGIEHIMYGVKNGYMWLFTTPSDILKLSRVFDVNFDYKDVAISTDIMQEYKEYGEGYSFAEYVFDVQDNNDGKLFIHIDTEKKTVKYAFTDYDGGTPMTVDEYMRWEDESMIEPYTTRFKKSELATYNRNKKYIEKNAQLMTIKELEKFKAIDRLTVKTA